MENEHKKTKELLKTLQNVDLKIKEMEEELSRIPEIIKNIEKEIGKEKEGLVEEEEKIKNLKKEEKLKELSLKEVEEKITKLSSQLYAAKTNEEYKAFLKEMEFAKSEKAKLEDEILNMMEEIEEKEENFGNFKQNMQRNILKLQEKKKDTENKEKELKKKLKEILETKDRLIKDIPQEYIKIYEKIKKNKGGVAVAQVTQDNRCSVCLNPVPLQKVIEIQHDDKLFFCEYCGRILID